ncbi:MAG: DUF948 domain-containing protein [Thermodesulfobacteriota bacterium]
MDPLPIFLTIASLSLIILLIFLVPFLRQLQQTAASANSLFKKVDEELEPLLGTINEAVEEVNALAANLNDKIDQTDLVIDRAKEASDIVLHTTQLVQTKIAPLLINIAGLNAGLQGFARFFRKK